jgi:MoaA/NifB/PqqE/SkfB family radical SAM enzyme
MSLYWDDFENRIKETIQAGISGAQPPLRRVSLHITNRCNFNCSYCNEKHCNLELDRNLFVKIVKDYSDMGGGILHITGGEPSIVKWLGEEILKVPANITVNMNTNMFKLFDREVYTRINRLKTSLDTKDKDYFENIVGRKNSYDRVINNFWTLESYGKNLNTSVTYTLTRDNYQKLPAFLGWYYNNLPKLYGVFFSEYKGTHPDFLWRESDIGVFWEFIVPKVKSTFIANGDKESLWLFEHSYRENSLSKIRFPENHTMPCYISQSELCINEVGDCWRCSHLYRDKIPSTGLNIKDHSLSDIHKLLKRQQTDKCCLNGCNLKFVCFNQDVVEGIEKEIIKIS